MTPSPLQLAIFDAFSTSSESLIIDAKAGAAKTTTIVWGLPHLPGMTPGALFAPSIRFLAFNKSIADTLQSKVPKSVVCSTFHSLGMNALKSSGLIDPAITRSRDWVDSGKVRKIVWNIVDRDDPDTQAIIKLVSHAKSRGIGCLVPDEDSSWRDMITHFEVDLESPDASIRVAQRALRASNAKLDRIDFDDMLYLAILLNCRFAEQHVILVDEAQDTNSIQLEILSRSLARGGRVIAVGDPHQAIYGFRGANADAMDKIRERFNAKTLPLDVSYRCSHAVIREAQTIVPDIKAWEGSPPGEVQRLQHYTTADFVPGSAILCRLNAPLVAFAYALLQRDVRCTILGKDFGAQLIRLVEKLRGANLPDLSAKLKVWEEREASYLMSDGKDPSRIFDQANCIRFFIDGLDEDSQSIASLRAKIELMFSDETKDNSDRVTLSSVHKSKGLEYDKVFILDRPALMPSKFAKLPWQQVQEKNLIYVAITRAKHTLAYINSDSWKETGV